MSIRPIEKNEIVSLTGVRSVAALWVVLYHIYPQITCAFPNIPGLINRLLQNGYLGVDLFFILSGFIIQYNYRDKIIPLESRKIGGFLWMRLARMWPVHVFILSVFAIFVSLQIASGRPPGHPELYRLPDLIKNVLLVHGWDIPLKNSWNVPSWSISCEWLAYLTFPVLACCIARTKKLISPAYSGILILLTTSLILQYLHADGNTKFGIIRIAGEFPAGCYLCEVYRSGATRRLPWALLVPSSIVAAILGPFWIFPKFGLLPYWSIPLIAVIILGIAHNRCFISSILSKKAFLFGGRVSYSFYMIHELGIGTLQRFAPSVNGAWFPPICIIWVAALAILLYFVVEEPSRRKLRDLSPFRARTNPNY